jgi:hypothetical protein
MIINTRQEWKKITLNDWLKRSSSCNNHDPITVNCPIYFQLEPFSYFI